MLIHTMTFLFGCLLAFVIFTSIKNNQQLPFVQQQPFVQQPAHTIDNYTSAQPPPPLSTNVSSNIVYPKGCSCDRNMIGVDCANSDCGCGCGYGRGRDDYRYTYNVVPHPHGYNLAGHHGGGGFHHGGGGFHK